MQPRRPYAVGHVRAAPPSDRDGRVHVRIVFVVGGGSRRHVEPAERHRQRAARHRRYRARHGRRRQHRNHRRRPPRRRTRPSSSSSRHPSSGTPSTTPSTWPRSRCRSTTTIRTDRDSTCSSPGTKPSIPTAGSVRCWSIPAVRVLVAATTRSSPPRFSIGLCSNGSTSSVGTRAAPVRATHRSTASTTTTRSSPTSTRPPNRIPNAKRSSRRHRTSPGSASARTAPSSNTSAPTTAPATSTRFDGRSARIRSRTSGSATAASSARRGRRCSPTRSGRPCSTGPPTPRPIHSSRACSRWPGSRHHFSRSWTAVVTTTTVRSTTVVTQEVRSRSCSTISIRIRSSVMPGRPRVNRGCRDYGGGAGDVLRDVLAGARTVACRRPVR